MSKKSKKEKKKKSKKDSKYKYKEKHSPSHSKETSKDDSVKHHHKKKKKHSSKEHHKDEIKHKNGNITKGDEEMDVPLTLMEKPVNDMTPMTKEQWEKQQSTIRRVYDETTGRHRLIKGDGEVIEEIVSRERHMAINKLATKGDQEYFQSKILSTLK